MPRLLPDANMPIGLRTVLIGHEVITAFEAGWNALTNGDLIAAAEATGFDMLVTGDQNLPCQQNLSDRKLARLVLSTNHWPTIQANANRILSTVNTFAEGSDRTVSLDRPPLRRRPHNPI